MPKDFILPDLGEGIAEAQIVRLLIKAGDRVEEDQGLMEVETDKAAVEIPSPYAGIAAKVHVKEGQTINVGDVVVTFDIAGEAAGGTSGAEAKGAAAVAHTNKTAVAAGGGGVATATPAAPSSKTTAHATPAAVSGKTTASAAPAVRKRARELGIDIDSVAGSGSGGRVTQEDLDRFGQQKAVPSAAGATAPSREAFPMAHPVHGAPSAVVAAREAISLTYEPPPGQPDRDKWGPIRRAPLSQIRKTIAAHMTRSATIIPHVTHGDEADIKELELARKRLNELSGGEPKLTAMAFVIRAVCIALRQHPIFNSSFDDEGGQTIYKEYIHIGVAVDSPRGLVVPVIRDADRLSLMGIALALRSISERIRTNQFAIEDLRGGTFTITNVGALGGIFSTPIINYPEVAILGIGRARSLAVFRNGAPVETLMLPINMSFDHRAADGANAARFTRDIIGYLENPLKFLFH